MYARLKLQTACRQIKKVRKKYASLSSFVTCKLKQSQKVLLYARHEHKCCNYFHKISLTLTKYSLVLICKYISSIL